MTLVLGGNLKIHHLRNATFIIELDNNPSKNVFILIDPMLGKTGSIPPFAVFKHKAKKNPLVDLPANSSILLDKVTHCLITHSQKWGIELLTHADHLDPAGKKFLQKNNIPVASLKNDASYLKKHHINITTELEYWKAIDYLDGKITAVPAKHGHGFIHNLMVNGSGLYLKLANEPSIYISGDTVLTDDVKHALQNFKPDITVVAAGNASLDIGGDILMPIDEIIEFISLSPGKVIANHLEALNHCPVTREQLRDELIKHNLLNKVLIPDDGETLEFSINSHCYVD